MELLDLILETSNLSQAITRVVENKGSSGIDGMSTIEERKYFYEHKGEIKTAIKTRTYKPKPVKRVEIPKPDGGIRNLGVSCVVDRICIWKSWKTISKRYKSLKKLRDLLKVNKTNEDLWAIANTRKGYIHTATHSLCKLLQNKTLIQRGLMLMFEYYTQHLNTH